MNTVTADGLHVVKGEAGDVRLVIRTAENQVWTVLMNTREALRLSELLAQKANEIRGLGGVKPWDIRS